GARDPPAPPAAALLQPPLPGCGSPDLRVVEWGLAHRRGHGADRRLSPAVQLSATHRDTPGDRLRARGFTSRRAAEPLGRIRMADPRFDVHVPDRAVPPRPALREDPGEPDPRA